MPLGSEEKQRLCQARRSLLGITTSALIYQLLNWLDSYNIFVWDDRQMVLNEVTDQSRMIALLHVYERKADSLESLLEALHQSAGIRTLDRVLNDLCPTRTDQAPPQAAFGHMSLSKNILGLNQPFGISAIVEQVRHFYSASFKTFRPIPHMDTNSTALHIDKVWVDANLQCQLDLESINFVQTKEPVNYLSTVISSFNHSRLIVCCGEPGYGKTTLVRRLAYDWSQGSLPQYDLVLCAKLREVSRSQNILDTAITWMGGVMSNCQLESLSGFQTSLVSCPREAGDSNQYRYHTLLVLDGLEEAHNNCTQLTNYLSSNESIDLGFDLLVTCLPWVRHRIYAPYSLVRLEGFESSRQSDYCRKHFDGDPDKSTRIVEISQLFKTNPALASLAQVPLLLNFICIIYKSLTSVNCTEVLSRLCEWMINRYLERFKPRIDVFGSNWKESLVVLKLGRMAFHSLLTDSTDQLTLTKDRNLHRPNFRNVAKAAVLSVAHVRRQCCAVGFLSKQVHFEGSKRITRYSFLHRSMRDYFAALYLAFKSSRIKVATVPQSRYAKQLLKAKEHCDQWQLVPVYNFYLELTGAKDHSTIKNGLVLYTFLHPVLQQNSSLFSKIRVVDESFDNYASLSPSFFKLHAQSLGWKGVEFSAELMYMLIARSNLNEIRTALPNIHNHACVFPGESLYLNDFGLLLCISGSNAYFSSSKRKLNCQLTHLKASLKHCIVQTSLWGHFLTACGRISQQTGQTVNIGRLQLHLDQLIDQKHEIRLEPMLTVESLSVVLSSNQTSDSVSLQQLLEMLPNAMQITKTLTINGGQRTLRDLCLCYRLVGGSVTRLHLANLSMPKQEWLNLFESFAATLKHLTIRGCQMTDQVVASLAQVTKDLQLQTLVLAKEPVFRDTNIFRAFLQVLGPAEQLKHLALSDNVLTPDTVNVLLAHLDNMPYLESLSINDNHISQKQIEELRTAVRDRKLSLIF